jgi:hypothetical protein
MPCPTRAATARRSWRSASGEPLTLALTLTLTPILIPTLTPHPHPLPHPHPNPNPDPNQTLTPIPALTLSLPPTLTRLRAQELLAKTPTTPFSLSEGLRAPTPPMPPSPTAALADTEPASAGLPPSLFSPRRLSASEILPPPRLPGEEKEGGEPFGLDLLALGGADPLPLVLSRPSPPRQHRREGGHKQAGPPLHLRTAPPTATTCAVAASCADGAASRRGAPGVWRDAGGQSGSALDCAVAPLQGALSQTPEPPVRRRGLADSDSWSPPSTM